MIPRSLSFSSHALLLGFAIALLCGCSESESGQARGGGGARGPTTAPATVAVAPVKVDSAQRTVETFGTLHGDEETTVSAKVSGRIVAVYRDIGDRVQPGEPLAQIERRDYELARSQRELAVRESLSKLGLSVLPSGDLDPDALPTVRKAKLGAENAEGKFLRGKQLHDQQPPRLSDQEFADLQTAFAVAQNEYQVQILQAQATLAEARARQADLELADQQLADTTVRAPAELATPTTGPATAPAVAPAPAPAPAPAESHDREYAIAQRMVSVGEFVNAGSPLFRLIDDNPIKLRAPVAEMFVGQVQVGQTVRVGVDAYDEPFIGRITRINPQIDPANRNFQVEALIENPEHKLKSGAFARVSIEYRREPGVLFVPESALVQFAGVNRVYVNENGVAAERIVELGARRGDEVEVRNGLRPDDIIVTSGASKLMPGTPLQID